jgi:hypothetical protein
MRKSNKLIRDGDLVAEIEIEISDSEDPWGPTMSYNDAQKIDQVRDAMKRHDYGTVRSIGRLYRLMPVQEQDPHAA